MTEVFSKLNPVMSEEPCDITLYAVLKTVFDASNFASLEPDQIYDILDNLSKQSNYQERINLFLNLEYRKKKKTQKISVLKEYYELCKARFTKMIMDLNSSFYCPKCQTRADDEHRINIFEAIPMYLYEYGSGRSCPECTFEYEKNLKIKSSAFGDQASKIELEIALSADKYIIKAVAGMDCLETNQIVKTDGNTLKLILQNWFNYVFSTPMGEVGLSTKLISYSFDVTDSSVVLPEISEENILFDITKLQKDPSLIEKETRKEIGKVVSSTKNIEEQERVVVEWIKKNGLSLDYDTFKNRYYPELDPLDLFEMALSEQCYKQADERIGRDAKIGCFALPSV